MFGLIVDVRATHDRIYVLDRRPPRIGVYDLDGQHLFDVGREGDGPGEYRSPHRIAIDPAGRLFVAEIARVSVFTRDGEFVESWPGPFLTDAAHDWVAAEDGQLLDPQRSRRGPRPPGRLWPVIHMVPIGPSTPAGAIVVPPDYGTVPHLEARDGFKASIPFWPTGSWVLTPSRTLVYGIPDKYRFEMRKPDGSITVVERSVAPIGVKADEADWERRYTIARMRQHEPDWSWDGADIPSEKPYFSSLVADSDNRIWVIRQGEGVKVPNCDDNPLTRPLEEIRRCWQTQALLDVFDTDGRFLGDVFVPAFGDPSRYRARGTQLVTWGIDDDGVPMVKRYQLVIPGKQ